MRLMDLRIASRLGIAFGLLTLLMVAAVLMSMRGMAQVEAQLEEITTVNNVEASLANEMLQQALLTATGARDVVLFTEEKDMANAIERVKAARPCGPSHQGQMLTRVSPMVSAAPSVGTPASRAPDSHRAHCSPSASGPVRSWLPELTATRPPECNR